MTQKQIYLTREARAKIVERFKCTEQTISIALHFKSNSKLSRDIRSYSVNHLRGIYLG